MFKRKRVKKKSYRELEIERNTLENKVMTLEDILANDLMKTLENNDAKTVARYREENKSLRKKVKMLKEMLVNEGTVKSRASKNARAKK